MSKTYDCERSLSPMILIGDRMVYVTREIREWFHLRFVQILIISIPLGFGPNAREIIP